MLKRWLAMLAALAVTLTGAQAVAEGAALSASGGGSLAATSGGVKITGVASSGDLTDKYGAYAARNAFDGSPATTWAENMSGDGAGAWIGGRWQVTSGAWSVTGAAVRAGYHKSEDVFYKNNRPKDVTVWIAGEGISQREYEIRLNDSMGWQYIAFDSPIAATGVIEARLTVRSVYGGWKYHDTCVSEFDLLVTPASGAGQTGQGQGATAGPTGAGKAAGGEPLYRRYEALTGEETYAGMNIGRRDGERCRSAYGSIGGVDIGICGLYALEDGRGSDARALLAGLTAVNWYEGEYGVEVASLLANASSVTLAQSELYAWILDGGVPSETDEFYRFELETAGGAVSLLVCAGYVAEGGDWVDCVRIP